MTRFLPSGLVALLAVAACQPAPPPSVQSPVQTTMFEHFALARDMRVFAVSGDLERLRVTAEALAEHEETWGLPPGSAQYVDAIRAAARRGTDVTDAVEGAEIVAEVASLCGECHLANDSDLGGRFQVAAPRTDDPAIRHTNYLSWTSRLLWDGLVGPSERMWSAGVDALAGTHGLPAPRSGQVPVADLEHAGTSLGNLAADAAVTTDPGERARIVAQVWTLCAECHIQAGVPQP